MVGNLRHRIVPVKYQLSIETINFRKSAMFDHRNSDGTLNYATPVLCWHWWNE